MTVKGLRRAIYGPCWLRLRVSDVGFGIKTTYPRLPFSGKLRAYLACSRPFTWLAVLVGVLAASVMAVQYDYTAWEVILSQWHVVLYGAATLLMVVIGNNFVNQATDPEDRVNRTYRPVVQGLIAQEEASTIGHMLWILGVLRATTLNLSFGVIVTILVIISYGYSHAPLRLKARPWMGNVGIGLARGGLGFLAAWSLVAPVFAQEALAAAGVLTIFVVGATTAKDFSDETGDRRFGVKTLVVRYGPQQAAGLSIPFIISPIILIPVLDWLGILRVPVYAIALLGVVLTLFVHSMLKENQIQNRFLEASRPWAYMYGSLLVLQVVLAIT